jgi:hypothetical protein
MAKASKKKMIADLKKSGMSDKEINYYTDNLNPLALESFYADMKSVGTFEPGPPPIKKKAMGGKVTSEFRMGGKVDISNFKGQF